MIHKNESQPDSIHDIRYITIEQQQLLTYQTDEQNPDRFIGGRTSAETGPLHRDTKFILEQ